MTATATHTAVTRKPQAAGAVRALVELARPITLPAPALGIATGALAGSAASGAPTDATNVVAGALALTVLNAGSNALNQYCDRRGDAIDKPKRPLPSGRLSAVAVLAFAAVCYVIASGFSLLVEPVAGRWAFAGLFAAALAATVAYSVPPIRAKRRWWAALPTIAVARGLVLFVAGWAITAPLALPDPWALGGVFALFLLGAAATKDWSDRAGDAATDCRTLPLVYGDRGAALRIAPFFVAPWFALLSAAWWLRANPIALTGVATALAVWGVLVARSLLKTEPARLAPGNNHPAWCHMYAMLAAAHVGVAAAYLTR